MLRDDQPPEAIRFGTVGVPIAGVEVRLDADDPEVLAAVGAAVEEANGHLARVEQIKRWKLLSDEWLPGGDELTPTMKLKRKPIAEKYAAEIEELYAGG